MPAARSGPKHARAVPFKRLADPDDIIIVSSDDEDEASRPHKPRSHRKSPAKKPGDFHEIVELSSDDALPTLSSNDEKVQSLELKLRKVIQENEKMKHTQSQLANQVADLQVALQTAQSKKSSIDASELEDSLSCEICTLKLWSPFILPECGHTFCQNCLQDWFGTALAQHKAVHPHYNLNQLPAIPPYVNDLVRFLPISQQQRVQLGAILGQQVPQPKYTCPICREPVRNRPVEAFALKNLVRVVAKAQGEESPKKPAAAIKGKSRRAHVEAGPWDKFFLTPT